LCQFIYWNKLSFPQEQWQFISTSKIHFSEVNHPIFKGDVMPNDDDY